MEQNATNRHIKEPDNDALREEMEDRVAEDIEEMLAERSNIQHLARKRAMKRSELRRRLREMLAERRQSPPKHARKRPIKTIEKPAEVTPPIEINDQFKRALDLMENTNRNLFITGKAGTGKSTLLNYFRNNTKKKVVVLAPTGVAALNVKGQTIHSFFGFKPDITPNTVKRIPKDKAERSVYKKIDAIIIDEASMVRADLLDCADRFMRINGKSQAAPFGGVQMIFIGDLNQIPPVVTSAEKEIFTETYKSPYFFSANVFPLIQIEFIELEKIYRQKNETFIQLLNKVRNNNVSDDDLKLLNERVNISFDPSPGAFYVYLTTINQQADEINNDRLAKIKGKTWRYSARTEGNFDMKTTPAKVELAVKPGAQVMMLNNDSQGRWVNGTMGQIARIEQNDCPGGPDEDYDGEPEEHPAEIIVRLSDGKMVSVTPNTWDLFRYTVEQKTGQLASEVTGTFTQYPLMLAWAVTIHKAQGKTFEKVILDIGRGAFVPGQVYVALSRCTSLEGIVLKKPLKKHDIFNDYRIVQFLTSIQYKISQEKIPLEEKIKIISNHIDNKEKLNIVYLKTNNEKSQRSVLPASVGEEEYMGVKFLGMRGFDFQSNEDRVFKVERILEMSAGMNA